MTKKEFFLAANGLTNALPLFYQPQWINTVFGTNWDIVFSKDNDGKIAGIFIYTIEKRVHLTLIRTPKLTPYFGLYLLPNNLSNKQLWDWEEHHINALIQQLPKYSYCQFSTYPNHSNFVNLHFLGFTQKASLTYYIDLKNDEQLLFENISTRTKRYIKNTIHFTVKEGIENLNEIIALHKSTFQKQSIKYPYRSDLISQLINNGNNNNYGKLYTLYTNENVLIAFLWVAYDGTTMYQILSSYNAALAGQEAIALLTWHAIKEAKKMQLQHYDFEGSILKGVEHFFRKFGGERKTFYTFEKHNSTIWKLKTKIF